MLRLINLIVISKDKIGNFKNLGKNGHKFNPFISFSKI
jgi:hypothetical protein